MELGEVSSMENPWRSAGWNHGMIYTQSNISLGSNYLAPVWGLWSNSDHILTHSCGASEVIGSLGCL